MIAEISPYTWGKCEESNVKDGDNISDLHEQISPIPRAENTDIKKSLFARVGQRDSFFDGSVLSTMSETTRSRHLCNFLVKRPCFDEKKQEEKQNF